jgi:PAS domain S-box-containing protein
MNHSLLPDLPRQPASCNVTLTGVDEELRRKEQSYQLLVENTKDLIWSTDLDLKWTYVSPAIELLLGYTPEEAIARNLCDAMTPASIALVRKTLVEKLLESKQNNHVPKQPYTLEVELVCKDGSTIWTEIRASFLRDASGKPIGILGIAHDITDHKAMEEALRRSEQRYRVMLETMNDCVWEVNAEIVCTYVSPKVRDVLGYEPEEIVGKELMSIISPDESEQFLVSYGTIIRNRESFVNLETPVLHKNGSCHILENSGMPLFDSNGCFIGYQGCVRDITDRKRAEGELRDYSAALESTNKALETVNAVAKADTKAKSEFLANMSHEIRTPMTAILGFADLLLESLETPNDLEAARTIRRNGVYLLNLINDILDLSKIEAGRLVIERVPCSPRAMVADVLTLMRVRAASKNLSIVSECVGPIPETIQTDPIRLRQVLINLIGNAIKFTEAGSVRVRGCLLDAESGHPKMQFEVIDTGIGMTAEQVQNLFQPFTQGDSSTSRKFGGTGLGLVISKRLAEALGGDIAVSSSSGKGSAFTLTVDTGPLRDVPMISRNAATVPGEPASHPKSDLPMQIHSRLLLAEDGRDNQRLLSFLLREAGAEVALAENGQIAVELALKAVKDGHPFDLILMDMQMPIMDGYDATQRLRAEEITVPIIALTAHAMAGDRIKCLDAGCNDYLSKPVSRATLLKIVAHHLQSPSAPASPIIFATVR